MSENRMLTFDHEATLEELAGVGKNRRFDEVIDDEENEEIQVICKRGDEEIPLAKRAAYGTPSIGQTQYYESLLDENNP
jgi:hypothetical protein